MRSPSRARCSPPTRRRSTSMRWQPSPGGRRTSSACTSSARRTSCGCSRWFAARRRRPTCWRRRWPSASALGKVPVVVGNCRGFVGNRMMFPYMYEAQFLVEEGATPEQVDRALTDFGMAMGIFAVDDMAGLDVAWRVRQELGHFSDAGERRPLVADKLYELGRYGQKRGKGWYRYDEQRKADARSGGRRADPLDRRGRRHSRSGRSPTRRSSSAASTRSSTKARASSTTARPSAPRTST